MNGVAWSAKRHVTIGLVTLFALVGGFGTWATGASIAGAIVSSGKIEVDRNRQVVQHLDGGIVAEILVDEGDRVDAGALLLRLDDSQLSSELLIVEGQLFELMARRGRFEAERDGATAIRFPRDLVAAAQDNADVRDLMQGQERLFFARRDSLAKEFDQFEKRSGQLVNQIVGIRAQQRSQRSQLALIQQELDSQQQLFDKGLAPAGTVLTLRRSEAALQGELGELIATEAQIEGQMTELEIERLKLTTQLREEAITQLRDLRYRELELAETRRSLKERLARLDITAPVGGVVYGLTVFTPRAVIRAAEPLLHIVPQDRPLVISARVDPIHVDQLYLGQTAVLRLSALDQRQTPELNGTVSQISADAFEDKATGASFFKIEITLGDAERGRLPEGAVLVPGMPVETFIRTSDQSPLVYLIKPLTDYFSKAFRET